MEDLLAGNRPDQRDDRQTPHGGSAPDLNDAFSPAKPDALERYQHEYRVGEDFLGLRRNPDGTPGYANPLGADIPAIGGFEATVRAIHETVYGREEYARPTEAPLQDGDRIVRVGNPPGMHSVYRLEGPAGGAREVSGVFLRANENGEITSWSPDASNWLSLGVLDIPQNHPGMGSGGAKSLTKEMNDALDSIRQSGGMLVDRPNWLRRQFGEDVTVGVDHTASFPTVAQLQRRVDREEKISLIQVQQERDGITVAIRNQPDGTSVFLWSFNGQTYMPLRGESKFAEPENRPLTDYSDISLTPENLALLTSLRDVSKFGYKGNADELLARLAAERARRQQDQEPERAAETPLAGEEDFLSAWGSTPAGRAQLDRLFAAGLTPSMDPLGNEGQTAETVPNDQSSESESLESSAAVTNAEKTTSRSFSPEIAAVGALIRARGTIGSVMATVRENPTVPPHISLAIAAARDNGEPVKQAIEIGATLGPILAKTAWEQLPTRAGIASSINESVPVQYMGSTVTKATQTTIREAVTRAASSTSPEARQDLLDPARLAREVGKEAVSQVARDAVHNTVHNTVTAVNRGRQAVEVAAPVAKVAGRVVVSQAKEAARGVVQHTAREVASSVGTRILRRKVGGMR